jgi:tetratricopeptide (TPR) repeat protein
MSQKGSKEEKVAPTTVRSRRRDNAILGVVCALVIGFYAWNARTGFLEPWAAGPQDNYYNLLVRSFRDGQLNLKRDVPPGIAENGALAGQDWVSEAVSGLAELSYYKGKLYLYFGIAPALLLFWPYATLTGHYLSHKDAVAVFLSIGFLASAGMLWAVWRRYFKETSVWLVALGMVALGMANFAPPILRRADVYEVAVSCGYALTMLALAGVWGALHDPRRAWRWLAAASLAYGLALGARPSLLFGAIILLIPVAQAWSEKRPLWKLLFAAGVPIVLIGLGLMLYNNLRFDSPGDFGIRHQLPPAVRQIFSPRYFWFNFRVSFLEPAKWSASFPFADDINVPPHPQGYFGEDHPFGVLTNIPVVWLALAAPLAWRRRPVEARSLLRWFLGTVGLLFAACALTLAFYDYIAMRYELEFSDALVLLAAIGALALDRALAGQAVWRGVVRGGAVLLVTFSAAFNVLAGFDLQAYLDCGLGVALQQRGKLDEAIADYQTAVQLKPDYVAAYYNLGNALVQEGKVNDAIAQYQKALATEPRLTVARLMLGNLLLQAGRVDEAIAQDEQAAKINPESAETHYCLGGALLQKGRVDEAIAELQKAVQLSPNLPEAQCTLGSAFLQKGKTDEAISHYEQAIQLKPDFAAAHGDLGNALLQKGRSAEAIAHFQISLQLSPSNPTIQNNLAWLLATCPEAALRDGAKAVALATRVNKVTGGENPVVLHTLAAAYAEAGRFAEAVETAQHALRQAPAPTNAALAAAIQSELKLYQAGTPFHNATPSP